MKNKIKIFFRTEYKFIILNIFLVVIFLYPLPYVIYIPGGLNNINERITIDQKITKGNIYGTYVRSINANIPFYLIAKLIPDWDIVSMKSQVLDNEEFADMEKRNKIYMEEANNSAIIIALNKANIPYQLTNHVNKIIYIYDKKTNNLMLGDQIISVENQKITDINDLKTIILNKNVGDELKIIVRRNSKEINANARVFIKDQQKLIGIIFSTIYDINSKYNIDIEVSSNESGPSAGLMTSLAIYNSLTNKIKTKKIIAGTGTINNNGEVGAIGGIKYKITGAINNNADIFLVPKDNYKEAVKVAKSKKSALKIYSVNTFDDALDVLINN